MNEEPLHPWIEPKLEARIVALVLGEASDFESEELEQLITEQPELAMFRKRIASLHGLLREASSGEVTSDDDDWKLSDERRRDLLAVIDGEKEDQSEDKETSERIKQAQVLTPEGKIDVKTMRPHEKESTKKQKASALSIAVMVHIGLAAILTLFVVYTPAIIPPQFSIDAASTYDSEDISYENMAKSQKVTRSAPVSVSSIALNEAEISNKGISMPAFTSASSQSEPAATSSPVASLAAVDEAQVSNFHRLAESKTALSSIRDSLDRFGDSMVSASNGAEPLSRESAGKPASGTARFSKESADMDADSSGFDPFGRNTQLALQSNTNGNLAFPNTTDGPNDPFAAAPEETALPSPSAAAFSEVALPEIRAEVSSLYGGGMGGGGIPPATELERLGAREFKSARRPNTAVEGWDVADSRSLNKLNKPTEKPQRVSKSPHGINESLIEKKSSMDQDGGIVTVGKNLQDTSNNSNESQLLASKAGQAITESKKRNIVIRDLVEENAPPAIRGQAGAASTPKKPAEPGIAGRSDGLEKRVKAKNSDHYAYTPPPSPRPAATPMAPVAALKALERKVKIKITDEQMGQDAEALEDLDLITSFDSSDKAKITSDLSRTNALSQIEADFEMPANSPRGGNQFGINYKQDSNQIAQKSEARIPRQLGTNGIVNSRTTVQKLQENKESERDFKEGAKIASAKIKIPLLGDIPITQNPPVNTVNQTTAGSNVTESVRYRIDTEPSDQQAINKGRKIDQILKPSYPAQEERKPYPESAEKTIDKLFALTPEIVGGGLVAGAKFIPVKKSAPPAGLNEKSAEEEAFSTFSLHVSDVSFKLAQAALAKGEWPEASKVRIEEFVNAFDYGDPMPNQNEKVACRLEQSIHPFLQQRNLMRVSMRTAAEGRSGDTPLRLTFLLDNSGSMERIDRQQTVQRAFALLAQQLKPIDQVTLISFARQPRLLADKVSGSKTGELVQLVSNLPSEGGTNLEAALQLAFEKAQEQRVENAQNRIIMLTDGAANLGDAEPESLSRMIETMREAGIAFDAAGIGAEGLNDEILEALTRKGDGRYYLLDQPEDADAGFARQIAGALRPAAKNVKVQIEFNPKRVGTYKLLGFEKHRLKKEDFRNDKVDAAEMAAAEAGVAVYQFEAKADGEGDVGSVSVRFRDMSTGQMVENRWPIPYEADAPRPDQAEPSLRIATSAALLAAKLKGEPLGASVDLQTLSNLIAGLPDRHRNAKRVQQLRQMINQARQANGK